MRKLKWERRVVQGRGSLQPGQPRKGSEEWTSNWDLKYEITCSPAGRKKDSKDTRAAAHYVGELQTQDTAFQRDAVQSRGIGCPQAVLPISFEHYTVETTNELANAESIPQNPQKVPDPHRRSPSWIRGYRRLIQWFLCSDHIRKTQWVSTPQKQDILMEDQQHP